MKKRLAILLAVVFVFSAFLISAEKPRIGVLRFTNNTRSAFWWNANTPRELADMLSAELVNSGEFSVLERKEIDAVITEQDFSSTGRVSKDTMVKMGNIKGARYLIAGTVSAFETKTSGVGGGVRIKGIGVGAKKEKAYIAVDVKVVDTETAEIYDAKTIEATIKSKGIKGGYHSGSFGANLGAYKKTPVGKAIRACILYITEYLECSLVEGKDAKCMKKWEKMDEKRKEKTKGAIDLDL